MADDRYRDGERGQTRSNSIFGDDDRERGGHGGGEDRGFLERAGEKIGSWLGGDEGGSRGGQGGLGGQDGYRGGRQSFSGGGQGDRFSGAEHEHYRNWRDRQIAELDRDYEDYCRERQQQFHSNFDSWRQSRQGQGGQSGAGASASTGSIASSGLLSGSGGTTGDLESEGGSGSTASSRTSDLLGSTDETGSGGDAETAGTGGSDAPEGSRG